jgi:hypothetical protein
MISLLSRLDRSPQHDLVPLTVEGAVAMLREILDKSGVA